MNKVIREGRVAVLYSPGYGAGWYTWNIGKTDCVFHPDIVKLVEEKNKLEEQDEYEGNDDYELALCGMVLDIENRAKKLFGNGFCAKGAEDLIIEWVPEGTSFEITEYDGSESITYADRKHWFIA